VFRKKSRTEVIATEVQEGLAHLGAAVTEARKATAEQLVPQAAAAAKVAQHAYEKDVAPRVEAAVAALAPQLDAAREVLVPRLEAARETLTPKIEAAHKVYETDLVPRLEAATRSVS
jgi:hypothetical protein